MPSLVYIFLGLFNLYNMNVIVSLAKLFKLVLSVTGRRPRASVIHGLAGTTLFMKDPTNLKPTTVLYSSNADWL